jgi:hypothetical protein
MNPEIAVSVAFERHVVVIRCDGSIVEIAGPFVAGGIQRAEPAANVLAVTQMVIADSWTHPSRSTVDHQPKAAILIAL